MRQSYRSGLVSFMSYLFYLIPLVLFTGPFLPDLFLSLIAILFLFISIKERNLNIITIILHFHFFYALIVISSLSSEFNVFT